MTTGEDCLEQSASSEEEEEEETSEDLLEIEPGSEDGEDEVDREIDELAMYGFEEVNYSDGSMKVRCALQWLSLSASTDYTSIWERAERRLGIALDRFVLTYQSQCLPYDGESASPIQIVQVDFRGISAGRKQCKFVNPEPPQEFQYWIVSTGRTGEMEVVNSRQLKEFAAKDLGLQKPMICGQFGEQVVEFTDGQVIQGGTAFICERPEDEPMGVKGSNC
jgi:hypothetical protein